ncbi:MAG: hypothetical protein P9M14_02985 [Candidatus Alcyoniella australis]|nr:hypothetical protein [Candidatus Alcyoniella australis]
MRRGLTLVLLLALVAVPAQAADWTDVLRPTGELQVRSALSLAQYEALGLSDLRSSDVFVYRAALGLAADYEGRLSGLVQLFYEEGRNEPLDLEQAWIKLRYRGPFVSFGRMYLPYGGLRTFGVEDPIVHRMTRSRRTAAFVGWQCRYVDFAAGAFNGEIDDVDQNDDLIDTISAGLAVRPLAMFEGLDLELGGYYLSDALEVDEFFQGLVDPRNAPYDKQVPGYGGFIWGRVDPLNILGIGFGAQYVTTGEFDERDYLDAKGEKTAVWALDAELALFVFNSLRIGGRYETIEGWDFLQAAGPPDVSPTGYRRYGGFIGASAFHDQLDVALEYLAGEDFSGDRTGLAQFNVKLTF